MDAQFETKPNTSAKPIMKNIVDTIRIEATPDESGVGEATFPEEFTPGLKTGQVDVPPMPCSRAWRKLGSPWPELLEDPAPVPARAANFPGVRVDPAGLRPYLLNDEKRLRPNRAAESLATLTPVGSGPVCP